MIVLAMRRTKSGEALLQRPRLCLMDFGFASSSHAPASLRLALLDSLRRRAFAAGLRSPHASRQNSDERTEINILIRGSLMKWRLLPLFVAACAPALAAPP